MNDFTEEKACVATMEEPATLTNVANSMLSEAAKTKELIKEIIRIMFGESSVEDKTDDEPRCAYEALRRAEKLMTQNLGELIELLKRIG